MKKTARIFLDSTPVFAMIALIPFVPNDYILVAIYAAIIAFEFSLRKGKDDLLIFVIGFFVMLVSESAFVATGVETFTRNTLLGVMPLWLPVLWGYAFVAIARGLRIIDGR
jgi:hypothetical protein